ncbi:MAG: flavin reductase family protein [archaeon]
MYDLVYPRQTVLVSCRGKTVHFGKEIIKDNLIAVDWHMPLSSSPMLYAVAISNNRFSYELIHKSCVFGVNFMPYELLKEVLFCGRNSGRMQNKFEKSGLTQIEAKKIDCCMVNEACAQLECEVIEEITTGDHIQFIGKVLYSGVNRQTKRLFHIIGDDFTTTIK